MERIFDLNESQLAGFSTSGMQLHEVNIKFYVQKTFLFFQFNRDMRKCAAFIAQHAKNVLGSLIRITSNGMYQVISVVDKICIKSCKRNSFSFLWGQLKQERHSTGLLTPGTSV